MKTTESTIEQRLTIRAASAADLPELGRLAQLDSARPLAAAAILVAELDGELVAARSLDDGRAIANPFRHTAGTVALLEARAAQLERATRSRSQRPRRRLFDSLRLSPAGRA